VQQFHAWLQALTDIVADTSAHWALRVAACRASYSFANGTAEALEASKFHRDAVATCALASLVVEGVPALGSNDQDGSGCTERADAYMFFHEVSIAWFQIVSSVQRLGVAERNPKIFNTYAMKCVRAGVPSLCIRSLRALVALNGGRESGANMATTFACLTLQMLGSGAGCSREILSYSYLGGDRRPWSNQQELRDCLSAAITLGPKTVRAFGFFKLEVYAAMAMAVIYGREEGDDGDITVPTSIVDSLLVMYREMLDGSNPGSPVNMAMCLLSLSISDANAAALVGSTARTAKPKTADQQKTAGVNANAVTSATGDKPCDILDSIALVLAQGKDVISARATWFRYDIAMARESTSEVLLHLSLSEKTVDAVEGHTKLQAAIDAALADVEHMTPKLKKKLSDVKFALESRTEVGKKAAMERVTAAAAGPARHVMLSYCWAQQELVVRIRKELGSRKYNIWCVPLSHQIHTTRSVL
jgi:ribosome-associated translation inhibitor RaiA